VSVWLETVRRLFVVELFCVGWGAVGFVVEAAWVFASLVTSVALLAADPACLRLGNAADCPFVCGLDAWGFLRDGGVASFSQFPAEPDGRDHAGDQARCALEPAEARTRVEARDSSSIHGK
jgi:hypothetical protein